MARQFELAIPYLETALARHPADLRLMKKLTISYVATGRTEQALTGLRDLLRAAPDVYLEAQARDGNCPCPVLLARWKAKPPYPEKSSRYLTSIGILELFCGQEIWREHFRESSCTESNTQFSEILDNILGTERSS